VARRSWIGRKKAPFSQRSRRRQPRNLRQLRVEPLEDRRLLATLTVNSPLDNVIAADGLVTLREAILAANADATTDLGHTGDGADTILFDFGHDGPQTMLLTEGQLAITDSLTIDGYGADLLTIDAGHGADGEFATGDGFRIFNVDDGKFNTTSQVEINGLTLTGGDAGSSNEGGAIRSVESLRIVESAITGNASDGYGGGAISSYEGNLYVANSTISGNRGFYGAAIYQYANSLVVISSNISGNHSKARGGGIWGWESDIRVTRSTISGNSSRMSGGGISGFGVEVRVVESTIDDNHATTPGADGGGIYIANNGYLSLVSSTISGNSTYNHGGGVAISGQAVISHSTFTENVAGLSGAAIRKSSGSLSISHSILAENFASFDGDLSSATGVLDVRFSLIGDNTNSGLTEAPLGSPDANGNLIGGPSFGLIHPRLARLADNGGPTKTHRLLADSPAIDAGDPNATAGATDVPHYDQRGAPFGRVRDGDANEVVVIDIGAYEVQAFVTLPALPGDYNQNGVVDAADYTRWRDTLGQTGLVPYSGADGNGDGTIGPEDYQVWKEHFGQTVPPQGAASGEGGQGSRAEGDKVTRRQGDEESTLAVLADFGELPSGRSLRAEDSRAEPVALDERGKAEGGREKEEATAPISLSAAVSLPTNPTARVFAVQRGPVAAVGLPAGARTDAGLLAWLATRDVGRRSTDGASDDDQIADRSDDAQTESALELVDDMFNAILNRAT
jgi:hypothetical protein